MFPATPYSRIIDMYIYKISIKNARKSESLEHLYKLLE